MTDQYPRRYEDVRGWATAEGVSVTDAGQRFAQYLILVGISQNPYFNQNLVFKGGNALEFVYEPNRSTTDLDFSFIETSSDLPTLIDSIKTHLNASLQYASTQHNTVMRLQSVRQNPPRPDAQFPTITSRIAYAFPDQPLQQQRLLAGETGANVIPVEMSVNETVCAWREISITGARHTLRVATLEDIVAEKLRAILQQTIRNRHREQDVLDIAILISQHENPIDTAKISDFLVRKCSAKEIAVTRSAYHFPDLRDKSSANYNALADTVRHTFIPFDEAWEIVMSLVDSLDIPA